MMREIVMKDRWIIDGNYLRTLAIRLQECDTVFLFDLPPAVCLAGARARIGKRSGLLSNRYVSHTAAVLKYVH